MTTRDDKVLRRKILEERIFQGSWLSIKRSSYTSRSGHSVEWEVVERARAETVLIIVAQLIPSGRYLLLRQFRAGINRRVIALPAGIVAAGRESPEEAIKELKEETGYTGRITEISPWLKINPAILNCDVLVFKMEIDENDPRNLNPQQSLEPEEEIKVILRKREEIKDFLVAEQKKGTAVDVAVWFCFSI